MYTQIGIMDKNFIYMSRFLTKKKKEVYASKGLFMYLSNEYGLMFSIWNI